MPRGRDEKIAELKLFLLRAVEALECHNQDHLQDGLIAELREAAEAPPRERRRRKTRNPL